jgi:hypothetical protein
MAMVPIGEQVKNLRRKEQDFRRAGDWNRAVHCKIIAEFLEDYVRGGALDAEMVVIV